VHCMLSEQVYAGPPKPLESANSETNEDPTFSYDLTSGSLACLGICLRIENYDSRMALLKAVTASVYDQRLQKLLIHRIFPSSLLESPAWIRRPMDITMSECNEFTVVCEPDQALVVLGNPPTRIRVMQLGIRATYVLRRSRHSIHVVAEGDWSFDRTHALLVLRDVRSMTGGNAYELTEQAEWGDWNEFKSNLVSSMDSWQSHGLTDQDLRSLLSPVSDTPRYAASRDSHPLAIASPPGTQRDT